MRFKELFKPFIDSIKSIYVKESKKEIIKIKKVEKIIYQFKGCIQDLLDDGWDLEGNGKYWFKSKGSNYVTLGLHGYGYTGDVDIVASNLIDKGILIKKVILEDSD